MHLRGKSKIRIDIGRGETHRTAKFTEQQAQAILDAGEDEYRAMAQSFGMTVAYAQGIRRHKRWPHLKKKQVT